MPGSTNAAPSSTVPAAASVRCHLKPPLTGPSRVALQMRLIGITRCSRPSGRDCARRGQSFVASSGTRRTIAPLSMYQPLLALKVSLMLLSSCAMSWPHLTSTCAVHTCIGGGNTPYDPNNDVLPPPYGVRLSTYSVASGVPCVLRRRTTR